MKYKNFIILTLSLYLLFFCIENKALLANEQSDIDPSVLGGLKQIASTEGFKPYEGNPIMTVGTKGSFDAGALGSMTILKVGDVFHIYYETWGVRSEKEWDAGEYESLQIGHATSKDGIHWTKDKHNPVLPQGGEADFDRTGVWDPYVIYEDGLFKMWYGGGGGSMPNFGWAYAFSKDGLLFDKRGLIGIGNQTGCEDVHVVRDPDTGLYYMYYWHGWSEPEALYLVTSPTETGFDFNEAVNIKIE
ncbi:MAG: glycoside hydrolase family protein, partial [Planctomycetota bacterium]